MPKPKFMRWSWVGFLTGPGWRSSDPLEDMHSPVYCHDTPPRPRSVGLRNIYVARTVALREDRTIQLRPDDRVRWCGVLCTQLCIFSSMKVVR